MFSRAKPAATESAQEEPSETETKTPRKWMPEWKEVTQNAKKVVEKVRNQIPSTTMPEWNKVTETAKKVAKKVQNQLPSFSFDPFKGMRYSMKKRQIYNMLTKISKMEEKSPYTFILSINRMKRVWGIVIDTINENKEFFKSLSKEAFKDFEKDIDLMMLSTNNALAALKKALKTPSNELNEAFTGAVALVTSQQWEEYCEKNDITAVMVPRADLSRASSSLLAAPSEDSLDMIPRASSSLNLAAPSEVSLDTETIPSREDQIEKMREFLHQFAQNPDRLAVAPQQAPKKSMDEDSTSLREYDNLPNVPSVPIRPHALPQREPSPVRQPIQVEEPVPVHLEAPSTFSHDDSARLLNEKVSSPPKHAQSPREPRQHIETVSLHSNVQKEREPSPVRKSVITQPEQVIEFKSLPAENKQENRQARRKSAKSSPRNDAQSYSIGRDLPPPIIWDKAEDSTEELWFNAEENMDDSAEAFEKVTEKPVIVELPVKQDVKSAIPEQPQSIVVNEMLVPAPEIVQKPTEETLFEHVLVEKQSPKAPLVPSPKKQSPKGLQKENIESPVLKTSSPTSFQVSPKKKSPSVARSSVSPKIKNLSAQFERKDQKSISPDAKKSPSRVVPHSMPIRKQDTSPVGTHRYKPTIKVEDKLSELPLQAFPYMSSRNSIRLEDGGIKQPTIRKVLRNSPRKVLRNSPRKVAVGVTEKGIPSGNPFIADVVEKARKFMNDYEDLVDEKQGPVPTRLTELLEVVHSAWNMVLLNIKGNPSIFSTLSAEKEKEMLYVIKDMVVLSEEAFRLRQSAINDITGARFKKTVASLKQILELLKAGTKWRKFYTSLHS